MRRLLVLLPLLCASLVEAQTSFVRAIHVQELPKCNKQRDGVLYAVDNADSVIDLGTGSGAESAIAQCDGDDQEWRPTALATCADLQGDPHVDIDTTDAGSDVNITPVDDLIVAAGDDFVISAGTMQATLAEELSISATNGITFTADDLATGDILMSATTTFGITSSGAMTATSGSGITLDATGGSITLDTDAAGSDVTATPVDDFLLTAGDAISMSAGGDILIDSTAGAGGVVIDTDAAASDVTFTPVDDLIATVPDDLTLTVTDDTTITGDVLLVSNTTLTVDPGGSTDELTVVAGSVRAGVALGIPSSASLPTCDSTIAPAGTTALYWDTTGPDLCACPEGADWVAVDGVGTCA